MTQPSNQNNRYPGGGRSRTPLVSIVVAFLLIVGCGLFLFVNSRRDDSDIGTDAPGTEAPGTDESETPPVVIDVTPPPETPEPTETEGPTHTKPPAPVVRGIYLTAYKFQNELADFIELCNTSEINAIVVDIKTDDGYFAFITDNERLSDVCTDGISDIEGKLALLKENGIYTIARVVCFKDPLGCRVFPSLALRNWNGDIWKDGGYIPTSWLDPYSEAAWDYLAAVAKEAARVGFDEIQLDYVRFPADGNLSDINFSRAGGREKAEAIGQFLAYIRRALANTDAKLAADVFGIIPAAKGDFERIGQDLDIILQNVDYVCPMPYPSHFANDRDNGQGSMINGVLFPKPDLEPYGVIYNIMYLMMQRVSIYEEGECAIVRPYLQCFSGLYLGSGYGQKYYGETVLEQIQANYDAGFEEWLLWNNGVEYDLYFEVGALLPIDSVE